MLIRRVCDFCFRGGECTVVAPPAVLSASAFAWSTCRGRDVAGCCGVSLLAKAMRLCIVALQSSALSAAGGKSRSSCALARASAGEEGSGGECTLVAPPTVLLPSAFVFSACRGREAAGCCGESLLAKAIRLWMVALQSSALSAAGGKSSSSCALASASAGVEGNAGERCEERDTLGLLTGLEGAVSRPGDRALLVPGRWP